MLERPPRAAGDERRCRSSMDQQPQSSAKSTAFFGLVAVAIGLFCVLLSAGLVPISEQPDNQEPRWLGIAFGTTFLFGGGAVVMQAIFADGKVTAQGLAAAAPVWVRALYHALCVGIVLSMGAIATWVAFGPGPRSFSGNGAFLGETGGRVAFAIGAALIWIVLAAILFAGIRQLLQRR